MPERRCYRPATAQKAWLLPRAMTTSMRCSEPHHAGNRRNGCLGRIRNTSTGFAGDRPHRCRGSRPRPQGICRGGARICSESCDVGNLTFGTRTRAQRRALYSGVVAAVCGKFTQAVASAGESIFDRSFTTRQTEVLRCLGDGLANKAISRRLGLSEKTVKAHVTAIFRALSATGRPEAIYVARQAGLI